MSGVERTIIPAPLEDWTEKFNAAKESKKLILIFFTATWCIACQTIAPTFDENVYMFPNVASFRVDVEDLTSVVLEFDVKSVSTFVFMRDGVIIDKMVGARLPELQAKLLKHSAGVALA